MSRPTSDQEFCSHEVARAAMNLPLRDAVRLMNGFLTLAGDKPEVAAVRTAYVPLREGADAIKRIAEQTEGGAL